MAAAQRSGGLAKIDGYSLTPPGTSPPQLRGRYSARSKSCSTSRADTERRRQHRIGTAAEDDIRCLPVSPARDRQDRAKRFIRRGHHLLKPKLLENATVVRRYDKSRFPPAGLAGGKAGQGARFVIRVGGSNAYRRGTIVLLPLPRNRASPQKESRRELHDRQNRCHEAPEKIRLG